MSNCSFSVPLSQVGALYSFYEATGGAYWSYWNYSTTSTSYYADFKALLEELGLPPYLLQNSVEGSFWNFSSFLSNSSSSITNPCKENWQGIICFSNATAQQCSIIGLLLPQHNLEGVLPSDLYQLSALQVVILNNNTVGGSISPLLPLTQLHCVELFANFFTGTVPSQLGLFTDVSYLNLGANCLYGTIPSEIGSMSNLRQFYLYHNDIVGTIPSNLVSCSHLWDLSLAVNNLQGAIPSQFSALTEMKNFAVYQNSLEGALPDFSKWNHLFFLRVHSNCLTGTIPSYIGFLGNLTELTLQYNRFHGTIPSALGDLKQLELLYIFNNHFVGSLPSSLATLSSLQSMLVQDNSFVGDLNEIFSSTEVLPSLRLVDFSSNRFGGSLPKFLFSLPNMTFISLVNNCFEGSLSPLLCNVSSTANLSSVILNGLSAACSHKKSLFEPTSITGTIPNCLFEINTLQHLHLSGNGLSGEIPNLNSNAFGDLRSIVMPFNRLRGPIPLSIKQAELGHLDLSNNLIGGTCDDMMIFEFNPSARLNLTNNRLSGLFPESFYSATDINVLEGNLFGCTFSNQQLVRDPNYDDFVCGSSTLDSFYILFASALTLSTLVYMYCMPQLKRFYDTAVAHRQTTIEMLQDILARRSEISSHEHSGVVYTAVDLVSNLETYLREMKLSILACYDCSVMGFDKFPVPQIFFALLMTEARRACTILCGILVATFCTFILATKFVNDGTYSTHTFQYGWTLSLSYINGAAPAVVLYMILWLLVVVLLVLFAQSGFRVHEAFRAHPFSRRGEFGQKNSLFQWLKAGFWFSLVLLLNGVVVVGVNAAFVYEQVEGGRITVILQILLVAFKLLWNALYVPTMCAWAVRRAQTNLIQAPSAPLEMQTWMILFNNVLAPCLATMVVDTTCFFNYFDNPNRVSITYNYEMCAFVNGVSGRCLVYFQYPYTVNYTLPFLYSDQCSSALVATYVPVYILMYFYIAFLNPLFLAIPQILSGTTSRFGRLLLKGFARIFEPASKIPKEASLVSLMNVASIAANLIVHFVILITFGAACPPLAIIVTIAIWSYTFQWQAVVGHFFLDAKNEPIIQKGLSHEAVEPSNSLHPLICYGIDRDCGMEPVTDYPYSVLILAVFHRDCIAAFTLFRRAGRHLVLPMSLFYSLFLFDFLESYGDQSYLYLPVTFLLLPIVVRYIMTLWFRDLRETSHVPISKSVSKRFVSEAVVDMFNPMRFVVAASEQQDSAPTEGRPHVSTNLATPSPLSELEMDRF